MRRGIRRAHLIQGTRGVGCAQVDCAPCGCEEGDLRVHDIHCSLHLCLQRGGAGERGLCALMPLGPSAV